MAAHTDQPPRPRRFIKAYLVTWGLLAIAAVAYLGLFALQSHNAATPRPQTSEPDPSQTIRAVARTAMELGTVRRSLSEVQNDVSALKEATSAREAKDSEITTRLSAVEERLATIHAQAEPVEPPAAKTKVSAREQRKRQDHVAAGIVVSVPSILAYTPPAPSITHEGPPVPLETGSLASKEEITFGEPVVTKAGGSTFAVQLAAGPSLDGLRHSWGQLRDRHGALATLEPRVVAPRNESGPYRLLAGPFASKAEADRVCNELNVGRRGCYVTSYIGTPL